MKSVATDVKAKTATLTMDGNKTTTRADVETALVNTKYSVADFQEKK